MAAGLKNPTRSDIIIIVLANMAVFRGTCLACGPARICCSDWVSWRCCWLLFCRPSVEDSWVHHPGGTLHLHPWVFRFYYLKYPVYHHPGMIAGEQADFNGSSRSGSSPLRTWSHLAVCRFWSGSRQWLWCSSPLAGLQLRFSGMTFSEQCLGGLPGHAGAGSKGRYPPAERTLRLMVQWAVFWLVLGTGF